MYDSSSLDSWVAAIVIGLYVLWFLYETSKGDKR